MTPRSRGPSTAASSYGGVGAGLAPTVNMKKAEASSQPPPEVENCAVVAISTPAKYACNGKTYTSYELAKMRWDYEKKNGAAK
jgi:hypothetical protein